MLVSSHLSITAFLPGCWRERLIDKKEGHVYYELSCFLKAQQGVLMSGLSHSLLSDEEQEGALCPFQYPLRAFLTGGKVWLFLFPSIYRELRGIPSISEGYNRRTDRRHTFLLSQHLQMPETEGLATNCPRSANGLPV